MTPVVLNTTTSATHTVGSEDEKAPMATEAAKDFEAMVLENLVDEMMKTVKEGVFGSAKNAEMWRSFLSSAVADKLAQDGGLGLSVQVSRAMDAYARGRDIEQESVVKGDVM